MRGAATKGGARASRRLMQRLEALASGEVAVEAMLEARLRQRRRQYVSFGIGLVASALLGGIALAILEFSKPSEPALPFMRRSQTAPEFGAAKRARTGRPAQRAGTVVPLRIEFVEGARIAKGGKAAPGT